MLIVTQVGTCFGKDLVRVAAVRPASQVSVTNSYRRVLSVDHKPAVQRIAIASIGRGLVCMSGLAIT